VVVPGVVVATTNDAARELSLVEVATIMGQADPTVTWKHYMRLFDRSDVSTRARAARASLELDTDT
jgi:hypothetical protein